MADELRTSRRDFVASIGASVAAAGSLATSTESAAQSTTPLKIVDFHNHYMGPSWTLTNLANVPPAARPTWERINGNLQSQNSLLASIETAGIAARVINTPTAFIEDADGNVWGLEAAAGPGDRPWLDRDQLEPAVVDGSGPTDSREDAPVVAWSDVARGEAADARA